MHILRGVTLLYFRVETKKDQYEIKKGFGLSSLPHIHNHLEIVFIRSGQTKVFADLVSCEAVAGDLFIAFPNQIHYYIDSVKPVNHNIIIVSPEVCPEFSRIFSEQLPKIPVYKNAESNSNLVSAFENIYDCNDRGDEYSDVEMRGSMLILMSEILRNVPLVESGAGDLNIVKDIITYCYENFDSDISLQSISDNLHVSKFYVSRIFSKRFNISFNDYINSIRIHNSCKMLKSGAMSITEIALAVGYNSVRSFDRCFMKLRGMTPKEYRANAFSGKKNKS